jgi:uncharacterized protein (TIGR03437 family)
MKRARLLLVILVAGALGRGAFGQVAVQSFPVGVAPLGVAMTYSDAIGGGLFAGVANSGSDSLSLLKLSLPVDASHLTTVLATTTVPGVSAPYAIAACRVFLESSTSLVVTSPSDGSVTVIRLPDGAVLGKVATGPQPRAIACVLGQNLAVVSNTGDDTLSIISVDSLTVKAKISGVAGASGVHGMGIYDDSKGNHFAWVGGTSANVVSVVNLTTFTVVARIPVNKPTVVRCCVNVGSEQDGTLVQFDPVTLAPVSTQRSGPGLVGVQDWLRARVGEFVTLRGSDVVDGLSTPVPGATALATEVADDSPTSGFTELITRTSSNSVYLIQRAPGTPTEFSVANGASFATPPVAPGSLASAFTRTGAASNFYASALPLPTSLGNLSLRIGGSLTLSGATWTYSSTGSSLAPLLFVGPTQLNFQVPPGIAPGDSIPAQLTKPDGSTLLTTLRIAATAPGIFSVPQNGQGQGAVLNQDFSLNGDPKALMGAKPAARGSVIQIFATGAGETTPALAAGEAAPASGNPLVLTKVQPTLTIGGKNAKVLFSGMAPGFVGLWQINAEVPADVTPGMAVPLVMTAGGHGSNTITIAVQ